MASKTTLNAENLEALGAERLAQLLIEISTGNAAAKRQLRLAIKEQIAPHDPGEAFALFRRSCCCRSPCSQRKVI